VTLSALRANSEVKHRGFAVLKGGSNGARLTARLAEVISGQVETGFPSEHVGSVCCGFCCVRIRATSGGHARPGAGCARGPWPNQRTRAAHSRAAVALTGSTRGIRDGRERRGADDGRVKYDLCDAPVQWTGVGVVGVPACAGHTRARSTYVIPTFAQNDALFRRDGAHGGACASHKKTTHTRIRVVSRETRRRRNVRVASCPAGWSLGFAPGSTALPAVKLCPTGSQLAFGEPRLKPFLAIRRMKLQNSCADRHRSLASIRRNVSLSICRACASVRRRSRRRARACASLRR